MLNNNTPPHQMKGDAARREAAQEHLRALERAKVDVRKTLQTDLDNIHAQPLKPVTLAQNIQPTVEPLRTRLSPSSIAMCSNGILVGTKDGCIQLLDPIGLKKVKEFKPRGKDAEGPMQATPGQFGPGFQNGHRRAPCLGLGASPQYIASLAGDELFLRAANSMYGEATLRLNKATALCVRGNQMCIAADKEIIVIETAERAIIGRLIGHVDTVTQTCLLERGEQILSCGLDSSLRLFDYSLKSQLIYTASSPLEGCAAISIDIFVGVGEAIELFSRKKRAALQLLKRQDLDPEFEGSNFTDSLFTAVAAAQGYDIIAVGAKGAVYLLQMSGDSLHLAHKLDFGGHGFVNALCLTTDTKTEELVLCGTMGPERRWDRLEVLDAPKAVFRVSLGKFKTPLKTQGGWRSQK